jgi:hypothetical protein
VKSVGARYTSIPAAVTDALIEMCDVKGMTPVRIGAAEYKRRFGYNRRRPLRDRSCRQPGAPGRQHHGNDDDDLGSQRQALELLKAIMPGLSLVAVIWNPLNPTYGPVLKELEAMAPTVGVKILRVEARVPADLEGAFKIATTQRAGALIAPGDPLTANRFKVLADLAIKYRLPTTAGLREFVEAGGLLSVGPDIVDLYRRAATHVDKILISPLVEHFRRAIDRRWQLKRSGASLLSAGGIPQVVR